ncbi:MAG TPA: hypothetical protein VM101_00680 [Flavitalea sp.]|nr:hypothetical protein [Flavitalea sp.]
MDLAQEHLQPDINSPVRHLYEHYFEDAATEIRMKGRTNEYWPQSMSIEILIGRIEITFNSVDSFHVCHLTGVNLIWLKCLFKRNSVNFFPYEYFE